MKQKILRKWKKFWQDLKILMVIDVQVFDDPALLTGGKLRPETKRKVREAHKRAGVPIEENNNVSAVNEQGQPITTIRGWNITLVGDSIFCEKPGEPKIGMGIGFLKTFPADFDSLVDFNYWSKALLGFQTEDVNQVSDWIRVNFPE